MVSIGDRAGLSPSAASLAVCGDLPEPLRRLAGYRPTVSEYGRLETEVSKPCDARQLSRAVLGDHPRRTADPPITATPGRIAGEEHAAAAIEKEGRVPAGVAGCMDRCKTGTDIGPSALNASSTGIGSGGGMMAPTTRMQPFGGCAFVPPSISCASIAWATTRAPDRRRSSATLPTWSGCQ